MNKALSVVAAPAGLPSMFKRHCHVPVPAGALQGCRWLLLSGGKLLRVLRGTYEPEQTQYFIREVHQGDCLFDVGSHVGWYTVLSSRLVGAGGKVVAFEASPRNHWFLARHVELNKLKNVTALHRGVAASAGSMFFRAGTGTGTGHLAASGEVEVPTIALDAYAAEHGLVPTHMKIDVEGGEMAVLRGARQILERHHPLIFLSTHGAAIKAECMEYLAGFGYRFESMHASKDVDAVADFICRWHGQA